MPDDADDPKVFVAVPTGAIKEYAILLMLAQLRNVDYPAERLELWFAVTNRGYTQDDLFRQRLSKLIANAQFQCPIHVLWVTPTQEEKERWGQYYGIICNMHALRKRFLDGDCDYLWLLGGDNPPMRNNLKRLLELNADVASAIVYQRPNRGRELDGSVTVPKDQPYPLFWQYRWTLNDLQRRRDLEPELKEALRSMWMNLPMIKPIMTTQRIRMNYVNFGSGCSLSTRRVQEHAGYYLNDAAYASEDLTYMQYVNGLGFTSAIDTDVRCAHFDPDGKLY